MRKSTKTVTVREGRVEGIGKNLIEAKINLKSQIKGWCDAPDPHVEIRFGCVLIVFYEPNGASCYRIIRPEHLEDHGKVLLPSCVSHVTMERAISEARFAVAQSEWSESANDDVHVARSGCDKDHADQLRSWIKWQRAYSKLIGAGYSATEAHRMACGD